MDIVQRLESLRVRYGDEIQLRVLEHITFDNGNYSMSVQASQYHYCTPRETVALNVYTHFEVMLDIPSGDVPEEWEEYNEGVIYCFVPKELVETLVNNLNKKYPTKKPV